MFTYPGFNPIALSLGPLKIRWYGLMYLLAFATAWWLARRRAKRPDSGWTPAQVDDLIFYCAMGVIVGGRIGYMLFYGGAQILENPLSILKIWEGGMSFHGGLLGVIFAIMLYARNNSRSFWQLSDFAVPLVPLGLAFGRVGNFINGELWGAPTDPGAPWAVMVNGQAVHASQLYEAFSEGFVLFVILWIYSAKPRPAMATSGLFLLIYGVFRVLIEFVRVPDAHIGYLAFGWVTMGQVLTLPMIVAGAAMLTMAYSRNRVVTP
ncbi:MAG: prolipoprotein diacylglyceryl transferase [Gammaproteobacteria bacterium]|nr:prolipoprotein diacylglyceryl transferase [Gammaproteobacteria bacterium]